MANTDTNSTNTDSVFTLVQVFSNKHTDRTGEVGRVEVASKGWVMTFTNPHEMIDYVEGVEPNFDWGSLWD